MQALDFSYEIYFISAQTKGVLDVASRNKFSHCIANIYTVMYQVPLWLPTVCYQNYMRSEEISTSAAFMLTLFNHKVLSRLHQMNLILYTPVQTHNVNIRLIICMKR